MRNDVATFAKVGRLVGLIASEETKAQAALRVERTLHEGFFREFNRTPDDVLATPLAPRTLA